MTKKGKRIRTDQKKNGGGGSRKVDISRHFPDDLPYFENRVKADGKLAFDFFFLPPFFPLNFPSSFLFAIVFSPAFFPSFFFSFRSTCLKRPLSVSGLIKFYRHKCKKREIGRDEEPFSGGGWGGSK